MVSLLRYPNRTRSVCRECDAGAQQRSPTVCALRRSVEFRFPRSPLDLRNFFSAKNVLALSRSRCEKNTRSGGAVLARLPAEEGYCSGASNTQFSAENVMLSVTADGCVSIDYCCRVACSDDGRTDTHRSTDVTCARNDRRRRTGTRKASRRSERVPVCVRARARELVCARVPATDICPLPPPRCGAYAVAATIILRVRSFSFSSSAAAAAAHRTPATISSHRHRPSPCTVQHTTLSPTNLS